MVERLAAGLWQCKHWARQYRRRRKQPPMAAGGCTGIHTLDRTVCTTRHEEWYKERRPCQGACGESREGYQILLWGLWQVVQVQHESAEPPEPAEPLLRYEEAQAGLNTAHTVGALTQFLNFYRVFFFTGPP